MDRNWFVVSYAVWERVAPLLPGYQSAWGSGADQHRKFLI
jgi:hypothetical protein